MKRTFFRKLFFSHLFILGILTLFLMFFSFKTIKDSYIDLLSTELVKQNQTISLSANNLYFNKIHPSLQQFVVDLGESINNRITIIAENGLVIADTKRNPEKMENHSLRPEVIQALQEGVGKSLRFSSTVQRDMLYVASLHNNNKDKYIIRTSVFVDDINVIISSLRKDLFRVGLIAVLISILIAYFFSKSFTTPINMIVAAFSKISEGDFETRVFLKNNDEFKVIADNFNSMTEKMSSLFEEIKYQKEELQSIIATMKAGLLVLNSAKKVVLTNTSLEDLLGINIKSGMYYGEVISSPIFAELVSNISKNNPSIHGEIMENNKVFLCDINYLHTQEQIMVIFHDITEAIRMEKMKRDFVVNVSHELRTPLTAINGFVETLEDEVTDDQKNYVRIIHKNTHRLINIVNDLLLLSELEEKNTPLEKESVFLFDFLNNIQTLFIHKIDEKGLSFNLQIDENTPTIFIDPFKMEQVFINIIDNALKYTEKGSIIVRAKSKENQVLIEIEDTGIGIEKEHYERLFERFYVTDKSRSRKVGGTGLGLSIVKHIVHLHGGEISFTSTPGVGTKFIINLPVGESKKS